MQFTSTGFALNKKTYLCKQCLLNHFEHVAVPLTFVTETGFGLAEPLGKNEVTTLVLTLDLCFEVTGPLTYEINVSHLPVTAVDRVTSFVSHTVICRLFHPWAAYQEESKLKGGQRLTQLSPNPSWADMGAFNAYCEYLCYHGH